MTDWDGSSYGDGAEANIRRGQGRRPRPLQVGLLGYGAWGRNWARVLQEHGALAWIVDTKAKQCAQAHADFPEALIGRKPEECYAAIPTDAVVIATPASRHYKNTLWALRQGFHVLVEKPAVETMDELHHINQELKETGLVYMVDYTFLMSYPVIRMMEIVEGLGKLRYARCSWTGPGKYRDDVDVLGNVGPHPLSVLLALTGRTPDRIAAVGRKWNTSCRQDHWDYLHAVLFWEQEPEDVSGQRPDGSPLQVSSGFTATVDLCWCDPEKTRHIVLVGENGRMVCDPTQGELTIQDRHGRIVDHDMTAGPEPLAKVFQAFSGLVRRGQQPIGCGIIGTSHMTHTLDLIRAAARVDEVVHDSPS